MSAREHKTRRGPVEAPDCERCEDAMWLLDCGGEGIDSIAARLGLKAMSLEAHLISHKHDDYAKKVAFARRTAVFV